MRFQSRGDRVLIPEVVKIALVIGVSVTAQPFKHERQVIAAVGAERLAARVIGVDQLFILIEVRSADVQRLSEQVTALDREVEESRKASTKQPAQKRSSVASATGKPSSEH